MSEREEYTPSMGSIQAWYAGAMDEYLDALAIYSRSWRSGTMIADVELVEMVARLISPYAIWDMPEDGGLDSSDWFEWSGDSRARTIARDKAKRVIDGLDLELDQLTGIIIGKRPEEEE